MCFLYIIVTCFYFFYDIFMKYNPSIDYAYEQALHIQYQWLASSHWSYEKSVKESVKRVSEQCYQILTEIPKKEKQSSKESFSVVSLIKEFNVDNFIDSLWNLSSEGKNMKINEKIVELQTIIDELRDIQRNIIDQEIQYQHFIKDHWIPFYSYGICDCSTFQTNYDDRIEKLIDKKNNIEQRVHQLGSQIHFLKEAQKKC